MSTIDHQYFAERERCCRRMAAEAHDPAVRTVHLQLARFYADRIHSLGASLAHPSVADAYHRCAV